MVKTGLSEVIGSWKIIPISPPRRRRICFSEALRRSVPRKLIWPAILPGGVGRRRRIAIEVTDLPQPDSPTTASASPSAMSKLRPSTARFTPVAVRK